MEYDVHQIDGIISFTNPNTTLGFVRYNKDAEIEYIFVRPSYRRMGLATRLINMVEEVTGKTATPQPPVSPLGHKLFKTEGHII
jgi:ribosomal protein S18 acetylase RimI-like enzyme